MAFFSDGLTLEVNGRQFSVIEEATLLGSVFSLCVDGVEAARAHLFFFGRVVLNAVVDGLDVEARLKASLLGVEGTLRVGSREFPLSTVDQPDGERAPVPIPVPRKPSRRRPR